MAKVRLAADDGARFGMARTSVHRLCVVAVLAGAALGLCTGVAAANASPTPTGPPVLPCSAADARLNAHLLDEARTLYAQALKVTPNLQCALEGLSKVQDAKLSALNFLEQGRDELARDNTEAAREALGKALAVDAGLAEARNALDALDASPAASPDRFAAAEALLRAGFVTEAGTAALDALKKALEDDPEATLPPSLRNLPNQPGPLARWWYATDAARGIGAFLGDLARLLVIGAAIVGVVLFLLRRRRLKERLEIGEIDDSAADDHSGPGLAGLIRAELGRLRSEGDGPSLGIASGIETALTLPAPVATASPTAGLVAAVAGFLGPVRHELTGEIGPAAGRFGRHLMLTLRQSDGTADAVAIPVKQFDPPAEPTSKPGEAGGSKDPDGLEVASVATVDRRATTKVFGGGTGTVAVESSTRTTRIPSEPAKPAAPPLAESTRLAALAGASWVAYKMTREETVASLPTKDWLSFALTRAGAELHEAGEIERASRLYEEALVLDPENRIALFNLGSGKRGIDADERVRLLTAALALEEESAGWDPGRLDRLLLEAAKSDARERAVAAADAAVAAAVAAADAAVAAVAAKQAANTAKQAADNALEAAAHAAAEAPRVAIRQAEAAVAAADAAKHAADMAQEAAHAAAAVGKAREEANAADAAVVKAAAIAQGAATTASTAAHEATAASTGGAGPTTEHTATAAANAATEAASAATAAMEAAAASRASGEATAAANAASNAAATATAAMIGAATLVDALKPDSLAPWRAGRLWYRIRYSLAVAEYERPHLETANLHAELLVRMAAKQLRDGGTDNRGWGARFKAAVKQLRDGGTDNRGWGARFKAAVNQLRDGGTDNRRSGARVEERAFIWDALLTTLVLLADMRYTGDDPPSLPTGLDRRTRHDLLKQLADGKELPLASEIIQLVCPTPGTPLPVRTHYNLACFWNHLRDPATDQRKGQYQERALYHLQRGVPDRRHALWADDDKDLATLKNDPLLEKWWATHVKSLVG